jgi:chromosome segregation DNA-binding protein
VSSRKRGLGRGLDALLGGQEAVGGEDELQELALVAIEPNPDQPRRHFDEDALAALAASIRTQGVVQPVVVRPLGGGRYQLVAGERRWRAARLAGRETLPALVRALDARMAMAVALVENVQRADLNPIEEAEALHRLIQECGLTHERAAEAVGRSRAAVSNLLRLLDLDDAVRELLLHGEIEMGHARTLLALPGERQGAAARHVVEAALSVRQTEAYVRGLLQPQRAPAARISLSADLAAREKRLRDRLGTRARLAQGTAGRGRLIIPYDSIEDLDELLRRID